MVMMVMTWAAGCCCCCQEDKHIWQVHFRNEYGHPRHWMNNYPERSQGLRVKMWASGVRGWITRREVGSWLEPEGKMLTSGVWVPKFRQNSGICRTNKWACPSCNSITDLRPSTTSQNPISPSRRRSFDERERVSFLGRRRCPGRRLINERRSTDPTTCESHQ